MINKTYLYDIKTYYQPIKLNSYSKRKIFCYIIFFHLIKIYFYYVDFSFDTFLATTSGLALQPQESHLSLSKDH